MHSRNVGNSKSEGLSIRDFINSINLPSRCKPSFISHRRRRHIIMIVSSIPMFTITMSVLQSQIVPRIIRMHHGGTDQWSIHRKIVEPFVDFLVVCKRAPREVRHYVKLCLPGVDYELTGERDGSGMFDGLGTYFGDWDAKFSVLCCDILVFRGGGGWVV